MAWLFGALWGRPVYVKRALVALFVLWAIGHSVSQSYHWRRVPIATVDPIVCTASGAVVAAWEFTGEPGVYHVHCQRGPTMVAGER